MRFRDALGYALKYHALALVPTLLGAAIAVAGLWLGVGQQLLTAVRGGLLSMDVGALLAAMDPVVALGGLVVGYVVRRVGRTALLVYTHEQAVGAAGAAGPAEGAGAVPQPGDAAGTDTADAAGVEARDGSPPEGGDAAPGGEGAAGTEPEAGPDGAAAAGGADTAADDGPGGDGRPTEDGPVGTEAGADNGPESTEAGADDGPEEDLTPYGSGDAVPDAVGDDADDGDDDAEDDTEFNYFRDDE